MKMLMPSHARRVKAYSDPVPLFQRYGAEDQLRAMYDPVVQLKSGGYLVINPTEALVSIDINSGRSTKEHGIEQTATATNVEAAREIARQLRLRDMAGLVVIDFIDMEYHNNVRKVERAMKDALKNDRARIQVGRISGFGLMEMSRQRLRTGVLEASTRECPHCDGTGLVRTASSAGLSALRLIEDEAAKGKGTIIQLGASTEASVYLLNTKRSELTEIEDRYNVTVEVVPEGEDEGAKMTVGSAGPRPTERPKFEPIVVEDDDDDDIEEEAFEEEEDRPQKKRRRRGGRGRNRNSEGEGNSSYDNSDEGSNDNRGGGQPREVELDEDGNPKKKRRRRGGRGRRGGRNRNNNAANGENGENNEGAAENAETSDQAKTSDQVNDAAPAADTSDAAPEATDEKPKRKRAPRKPKADVAPAATDDAEATEEKPKPKRTRRKKADDAPVEAETTPAEEAEKPKAKRAPRKKKTDDAPAVEAAEKPKAKRAPRKKKTDDEAAPAPKAKAKAAAPAPSEETASEDKPAKKRGGWWQRTFGE
jgi:ribonuclease E